MAPNSQNWEWFRLDGTSKDHLAQPTQLKQWHLEPASQDGVQTAFQSLNLLSVEKGLGKSEEGNNYLLTSKEISENLHIGLHVTTVSDTKRS